LQGEALPVSLNQPYHPAPIHSIKRMHDVVPVEYRQQAFHSSGRIAFSPRLNVFPEDPSGVLYGAHQRFLVGIIHNRTRLRNMSRFKLGLGDSFRRIFGRLWPVRIVWKRGAILIYRRELLSRVTVPITYTLQGS
jgi:hypothetical protein